MHSEIRLRKAQIDEKDRIWNILQQAIERRRQDGSTQWQQGIIDFFAIHMRRLLYPDMGQIQQHFYNIPLSARIPILHEAVGRHDHPRRVLGLETTADQAGVQNE